MCSATHAVWAPAPAGWNPRTAIAIRFPSTNKPELYAKIAAGFPEFGKRVPTMGFAYMVYPDAGRLCAAVIAADLPGYRCYMPSSKHNVARRPTGALLRDYYAGVPLRGAIAEGDGTLVDLSRIEAETGWRPVE